jgi:hypothetical protein
MNENSKCALPQPPDELLQGNRGAATEFAVTVVTGPALPWRRYNMLSILPEVIVVNPTSQVEEIQ